jgi:hypothetical protein
MSEGFRRVTGLWKAKSVKGEEYLSGPLGPFQIFVFRNKYKDKPQQPDYALYVGFREEEPKQGTKQEEPKQRTLPDGQVVEGPAFMSGISDNDIPF